MPVITADAGIQQAAGFQAYAVLRAKCDSVFPKDGSPPVPLADAEPMP